MKIAIGGDHTAVEIKAYIKEYLDERNIEYKDFGTNNSDSVDYPDYGEAVGVAVASGEYDLGILICGTGVGISLSANKVPGIRAVVCSEPYSAKLARMHNNANIVAFGARVVGFELARMIVEEFLNAEFEGERHQRRVDKIIAIEKKYNKA